MAHVNEPVVYFSHRKSIMHIKYGHLSIWKGQGKKELPIADFSLYTSRSNSLDFLQLIWIQLTRNLIRQPIFVMLDNQGCNSIIWDLITWMTAFTQFTLHYDFHEPTHYTFSAYIIVQTVVRHQWEGADLRDERLTELKENETQSEKCSKFPSKEPEIKYEIHSVSHVQVIVIASTRAR